jgi:hypothetical protein
MSVQILTVKRSLGLGLCGALVAAFLASSALAEMSAMVCHSSDLSGSGQSEYLVDFVWTHGAPPVDITVRRVDSGQPDGVCPRGVELPYAKDDAADGSFTRFDVSCLDGRRPAPFRAPVFHLGLPRYGWIEGGPYWAVWDVGVKGARTKSMRLMLNCQPKVSGTGKIITST